MTKRTGANAIAGIAAAFLSAILCGCFGDSSTGPDKESDIRFPFAVGNEWMYRCTHTFTTMTADDTTQESGTEEATWRIAALENIGGRMAYRMEISQKITSGPDSGKSITYSNWYADSDSMVVAVASELVEGKGKYQSVQLYKTANPFGEISGWNVTVLRYPLACGSQLRFSKLMESDFKKVESRERITVNGREYDAFRIVRNLEGYSNNTPPVHYVDTIIQWFSPEGLIKTVRTWAAYEDSATYSGISTFELVSCTLR